jgi:hypothetical protein
MDALIGHSGFVGTNLHRQRPFDYLYNSKNIGDICGRSFELIVCAGIPAASLRPLSGAGPAPGSRFNNSHLFLLLLD